MTDIQKGLAVLGLVALFITTWQAPYDFVGVDEAGWTARGAAGGAYQSRGDFVVQGTVYAPVWAPPDRKALTYYYYHRDSTSRLFPTIQHVELATGRLALAWAAIAAVTGVAMLLAAPSRRGPR